MSDPQTSEQLLQQGQFHHRQGQIELAMERYTEVLRTNPENAEALYWVALVACQSGQFKEGADLARRAISFGKKDARTFNLLGQALDRLGEPLEALKNFDAAIGADPNFADAHGNRANILVDADRPAEALKSFERALALDPDSAADLINRGVLLQDLGRHAEALADYDRALALMPKDKTILFNRANALAALDRLEEAEAAYDAALAQDAKFALAHLQRGLTLKYLGRFAQARTAIERAIELDKKDAAAAYTLAQLLLLTGDWREGLPLFETRASLAKPAYAPLDFLRWQGEAPGNYRLVLLCEQGLGDTVQFCRYAALLGGRGYPVTLVAREALAPLLRSLPGIEKIVISAAELAGDPRPVRWLPLMSTMQALHLKPNSIPQQGPYLAAEPARIERFREWLGPQGFKIGIAWQGTSWLSQAPLAAFAGLADIPGVRLISLQKQPGSAQIGEVPFGTSIERLLDEADLGAEALLDTAALMANLDLVVSIDAMPAHLAGALGRPVYLALRNVPEWRWLTEREDSPWYASMRLFRQGPDRQWGPVFARIAEAARALAASQNRA
jgi:tetratricopeptide (TPR) repeat protein